MNLFLIAALPPIMGFMLDLAFGDPYSLPHPVRLIGRLISFLERLLRRGKNETAAGALLANLVLLLCTATPLAILIFLYEINIPLGAAAEGIMCYYLFAARCLYNESMKVCRALEKGDIESARRAVSMIVGRDTAELDAAGITRAAVETVAENTVDGVTAPMFYVALFGAPGGFFYKASNTMDSMIGYKNEKYLRFGRFAAKLDDALNFIVSRLTALVMILSAFILGMDGKNAYNIWHRDRLSHASPNSAQTESVCAGALGIRLGGDASYFGVTCHKPTIGDELRPVAPGDVRRANSLMYLTSVIFLLLSTAVRTLILGAVL